MGSEGMQCKDTVRGDIYKKNNFFNFSYNNFSFPLVTGVDVV